MGVKGWGLGENEKHRALRVDIFARCSSSVPPASYLVAHHSVMLPERTRRIARQAVPGLNIHSPPPSRHTVQDQPGVQYKAGLCIVPHMDRSISFPNCRRLPASNVSTTTVRARIGSLCLSMFRSKFLLFPVYLLRVGKGRLNSLSYRTVHLFSRERGHMTSASLMNRTSPLLLRHPLIGLNGCADGARIGCRLKDMHRYL